MFRTTLLTLALVAGAAPLAAQSGPQTITKAKWLSNAETEFGRVDTNKDGQMSRAEIETFQKAAAVRMIAARSQAVFAKLDADHNGQLSATEFAKLNNTDPKVDISNVMSVDTNKDGKVSLAEHKAATLETFTTVDANKDGIVTEAEVDAMAAAVDGRRAPAVVCRARGSGSQLGTDGEARAHLLRDGHPRVRGVLAQVPQRRQVL